MKRALPDERGLAEAAQAIRDGLVVAYPTETVYGLAVDPFNESALNRLYDVKGRGSDVPVLLIAADMKQVQAIADVSEAAMKCADAFWPGPLSMLLTPCVALPQALIGETGKVCVRCTSSPVAQALCRAYGGAITSTSANRHGEAPATNGSDINLPGVAVTIDAGQLELSEPSTVFDPDSRTVLREGAIDQTEIQRVLS